MQHFEAQLAEIRTGHQQMIETQKQQAEQTRVVEEGRTIVGAYQCDSERYAASEQAFVEAYQHLVHGRVNDGNASAGHQ
ncbi:hypothetical protein GU700_19130 [Methylobacterium sp. NI91]|nr:MULTISPECIES: hypothetical protein [unclassified Methylobacterium]QIJ76501.1 hypothetical protein CLZ_19125 [Methylobacterium sp. CLZ]QIJ81404.1 hypothetical protein GU700_19130 [Methylobacterium sp. NI91]